MTKPRSDLRLLLQLMEGTIPSTDRAALRERMSNEKRLRNQWQQLNSIAPDLANASQTTTSPNTVAAFLSGAMSIEDELAFESHCWESKAALLELVQLTVPPVEPVEEVDQALTDRLLKLGPKPVTPTPPEPRVRNTAPAERSQRDRTKPDATKWLIAGMAGIIAALVVAIIWVWQPAPDPEITNGEQVPPKQEFAEQKQMPLQEAPDVPLLEEVPKTFPPKTISPEDKAVVETPPATRDVPPEVQPPKAPTVVAAKWDVNGVMGARRGPRSPWRGLNFEPHPVGSGFLTLPSTRAVTKGPGNLELVLGEETQIAGFSWQKNRDNQVEAEVTVIGGRVAYRGLKAGDVVRFLVTGHAWEAKAHQDETEVSLSMLALDPRLTVHQGAVDVNDRRIKRNRYVDFTKPREVEQVERADRNRYDWVQTAYSSSKVPADIRAAWLVSDNLRRDVLQSKQLDARGTLMFAPVKSVYRLLNSADTTERAAALRWLVNNPPGTPDTPGELAWAEIAKRENPRVANHMNGWLHRVRTRKPAADLYPEMVRTLWLPSRASRHVAITCLRYFSGQNFGYEVNGSNAARTAIANKWNSWINGTNRGPGGR